MPFNSDPLIRSFETEVGCTARAPTSETSTRPSAGTRLQALFSTVPAVSCKQNLPEPLPACSTYRKFVVSNLYMSHISTFAPECNLLFLFDLGYLARILLSLAAAHAKLICATNKEAIQ